ncbi:hypothetical protein BDK51DRAFT_39447 [Blyttiomyces helicus]|uniref:Uncharacterized protein n=1 Tax=Blyttiomyces helicus TaxID=388810 RepID=A0A4P9WA61_9FUNG|nr:hypothetical protein BDK51DRAFT_39447 [Blyttiomyces helicus]|eukprot:RKO88383.1 hypothetical protein BDK51DRAFT_39447 [Blyttiomyces helicus]
MTPLRPLPPVVIVKYRGSSASSTILQRSVREGLGSGGEEQPNELAESAPARGDLRFRVVTLCARRSRNSTTSCIDRL